MTQSNNVSSQVNKRETEKANWTPHTIIPIHHEHHSCISLILFYQAKRQRRTLKSILPSASMPLQRGRQCCWERQHSRLPIKVWSTSFSLFFLYFIFLLCISWHSHLHIENRTEDLRVRLEASIKACKKTLKAGSATYAFSPSSAEIIWKVLSSSLLL